MSFAEGKKKKMFLAFNFRFQLSKIWAVFVNASQKEQIDCSDELFLLTLRLIKNKKKKSTRGCR